MIKPGRQLAWQKKQIEIGKCPHCGKEPTPEHRFCWEETEKRRQNARVRRGVEKTLRTYIRKPNKGWG